MPAYEDIIDSAVGFCRSAGDILLSGFRSKDTVVSYKSRTDLVTNIDKESEEYIVAAIRSRFHGHSIVAEEGSGRETDSEFIWYVDPLDATNNFAHGIPFFCVSIGVYSRVEEGIICGAVFDPCHNEMFHAVKGKGAYCNGERIAVSRISELGIALLATGFPYAKDDMEKNNLKEFCRFLPGIQCIRRMGSAALDLCYVASGRVDGFWEPMLKPWDTAAGSLIVQEAGGIATKYDGSEYDPLYPQMLASNGLLHSKMIDILTLSR
jgi:myo-inositol-1(or 4)-monophosphatase